MEPTKRDVLNVAQKLNCDGDALWKETRPLLNRQHEYAQADTFGKYTIKIDVETAETLLDLVQTLDFSTLTKSQVYALNGLQLNLEAIKEEANV
jgi:hypothetical protein